MWVRSPFALFALGALLLVGCGGSSGGSSAPAVSGVETIFGPVATRAVGDGLRKPVIINAEGVTFVGLAGATFTNVALVNPSAARIGADASNLAYFTTIRDAIVFAHPRTRRQRTVHSTGAVPMHLATSADGFRVFFVQRVGVNQSIRAVNMDGTGLQILYTHPTSAFETIDGLSISPDGTNLAYVIATNIPLTSTTYAVRRMPSSGGSFVSAGTGSLARFTANGAQLVVKRSDGIYSMNLSGGDATMFTGTADVTAISEAGTWGQTLANSTIFAFLLGGSGFPVATAGSSFDDLVAHRNLPFVAGKIRTEEYARLYNTLSSATSAVDSLEMGRWSAFLPHRERRDAVAPGTADPQVAGFVASQLGRHAGSIVAWDAQTRPATAVVAEGDGFQGETVVYTVDAGASNKITRVFSLESVWESKNVLSLAAPVDGLVISFDARTGLPGAIIPYLATRGGGKPKITRLPGGGVRVEGELAGVFGSDGKSLSGPTSAYETSK